MNCLKVSMFLLAETYVSLSENLRFAQRKPTFPDRET